MFVSEENRIVIDAHGMTMEEIKYELDIALDFLDKNIKEVMVIHGYKYGQRILRFLREEYTHPNIVKLEMDRNPGVTRFSVKPNKVLGLEKRRFKKVKAKGKLNKENE